MDLPIGTSPNDPCAPWNPASLTVWDEVQKEVCRECETFLPVDDDCVCEDCFEPKEVDLDEIESSYMEDRFDLYEDFDP